MQSGYDCEMCGKKLIVQGVFFTGPPLKCLSMELVLPQYKKWLCPILVLPQQALYQLKASLKLI